MEYKTALKPYATEFHLYDREKQKVVKKYESITVARCKRNSLNTKFKRNRFAVIYY